MPQPVLLKPRRPLAGPGSATGLPHTGRRRSRSRRRQQRPEGLDTTLKPPSSPEVPSSPLIEIEKENYKDESSYIGAELLQKSDDKLSSSTAVNYVPSKSVDTETQSRYALALDTRFPQKYPSVQSSSTHSFRELVRSLVVRGAEPCLVSWTVDEDSKSHGSGKIGRSDVSWRTSSHKTTRDTLHKIMDKDASCLAGVGVRWSASDMPGTKSIVEGSSSTDATPSFSAKQSWKLFSGMIDSIVDEDKRGLSDQESSNRPLLRIIIVTTHTSLAETTGGDRQGQAARRFCLHLKEKFSQSLSIASIQILVCQTKGSSQYVDRTTATDQPETDDAMTENLDSCTVQQLGEGTNTNSLTSGIKSIQQKFENWNYDTGNLPIHLSLEVVEGTYSDFEQVSQIICQQCLIQHMTVGRLEFEMPETLDGTQCRVSLDLSYQYLPFMIRSKKCTQLLEDLDLLSNSEIEVLQLVPLALVDAGLLYGVPMTAKSGLVKDIDQFAEIQVLTRVLFRLLQERQLAIVLRATSGIDDSSTRYNESRGLFHANTQILILMAQEMPKSSDQAPYLGLVYRYVAGEHAILGSNSRKSSYSALMDEAIVQQYEEYLDDALGSLECRPFNPFAESYIPRVGRMALESCVATESDDGNVPGIMSSRTNGVDCPPGSDRPYDESPEIVQEEPKAVAMTRSDSALDVWDDSIGIGVRGVTSAQFHTHIDGVSDDEAVAFDYEYSES